MKFFIHHWYHVGLILAIILLMCTPLGSQPTQKLLMLNLVCLCAHQFEEYQLPGGAPLIINRVIYHEDQRASYYPGNALSIMVVNVSAWFIYGLSIWFYQQTWLGLGVILFSLFQILGHVVEMPISLHAWYNPGMATTLLLFLPLGSYFIYRQGHFGNLSPMVWLLAVITLVFCILLTIILPVQSLKNLHTPYPISEWQVKRYKWIMDHCRF